VAIESATAAPVIRRVTDPRAVLGLLLATLAAMAWGALWLWSLSPWSRYLGEGGWGDAGALAALCRAIPQGDIHVPAVLHAIAWVVMIAAMMLPTTLPLLLMFRRITQSRSDGMRLAALVVLGFFVAWFGFGVVAHVADQRYAQSPPVQRGSSARLDGRRGGPRRRRAVPVQRTDIAAWSSATPVLIRGCALAWARTLAGLCESVSIMACSASAAAGRC
jgi:hypothetical protein